MKKSADSSVTELGEALAYFILLPGVCAVIGLAVQLILGICIYQGTGKSVHVDGQFFWLICLPASLFVGLISGVALALFCIGFRGPAIASLFACSLYGFALTMYLWVDGGIGITTAEYVYFGPLFINCGLVLAVSIVCSIILLKSSS